MIKKEIEVLTQRQAFKEEEVFDSVNKKLSESKCGFREMLLEIKEHFKKEPLDRNRGFMKEL